MRRAEPEEAAAMRDDAHGFFAKLQVGQRSEIDDGDARHAAVDVAGRGARGISAHEVLVGFALERLADEAFGGDRNAVMPRAVAADGNILAEIETSSERRRQDHRQHHTRQRFQDSMPRHQSLRSIRRMGARA